MPCTPRATCAASLRRPTSETCDPGRARSGRARGRGDGDDRRCRGAASASSEDREPRALAAQRSAPRAGVPGRFLFMPLVAFIIPH